MNRISADRSCRVFGTLIAGFCLFTLGSLRPVQLQAQPTTTASPPSTAEGQIVTVPGARQFDFTSKINRTAYRVMVFPTPKVDLSKPQPALYLFDGNYYFASACEAMKVNQLSGIIVGIGYPTDDFDTARRSRTLDLSLPKATPDSQHGGGDAFLRVVEEEVKPLVASHCKIDPARTAVFGHSLGGLMVLRQLFREPTAYTTYIAASPSIWWNNRAVLADEAAFSKRVKSGELHLRLVILSAGDEQYHGADPKQLEKAARDGMVINATELANRLTPLNPTAMPVTRSVLPDETHRSGAVAELVRALNFAFQGGD